MTLSSRDLIEALRAAGVDSITGVPCSSMTGLIADLQHAGGLAHANAPNEGEALGYAAGRWLGGGLSAVYLQNSGLGNMMNALTSLISVYRIPVALLVGWRGRPGEPDEPQHRLMGEISIQMLRLCGAEMLGLLEPDGARARFDALSSALQARRAAALMTPRGAFKRMTTAASAAPIAPAAPAHSPAAPVYAITAGAARADRREAITRIADAFDARTTVVATTGLISREYYARADHSRAIYLAGAMGHAASVGLGVAEAGNEGVLVIDGDGAVLMRPGGAAFVGAAAPRRLAHLVLDNEVHESTGAQPTLSPRADLAVMAAGFGYCASLDTDDPDRAIELCQKGVGGAGPVFVRLRIRTGPEAAPRIPVAPDRLASRYRDQVRPGVAS